MAFSFNGISPKLPVSITGSHRKVFKNVKDYQDWLKLDADLETLAAYQDVDRIYVLIGRINPKAAGAKATRY